MTSGWECVGRAGVGQATQSGLYTFVIVKSPTLIVEVKTSLREDSLMMEIFRRLRLLCHTLHGILLLQAGSH